jgi:hypothetical protein
LIDIWKDEAKEAAKAQKEEEKKKKEEDKKKKEEEKKLQVSIRDLLAIVS